MCAQKVNATRAQDAQAAAEMVQNMEAALTMALDSVEGASEDSVKMMEAQTTEIEGMATSLAQSETQLEQMGAALQQARQQVNTAQTAAQTAQVRSLLVPSAPLPLFVCHACRVSSSRCAT